jgi:hypothetical protein
MGGFWKHAVGLLCYATIGNSSVSINCGICKRTCTLEVMCAHGITYTYDARGLIENQHQGGWLVIGIWS